MPHSNVDFFFQAEDGIRDSSVTGVQTCALPISGAKIGPQRHRPVTGGLKRHAVRSSGAKPHVSYTVAAALAKSEYPTSAAGRPYRKEEVVPVAIEAGSKFVGIDEKDGQPVGGLLGFVTHRWTQIPCRAHTVVHTQTPDHCGVRRVWVVLGGLK